MLKTPEKFIFLISIVSLSIWVTGCNEDDKKIFPNIMVEDGGIMMVKNYAKNGEISILELGLHLFG